jgi:hypothetical protein
MTTQEQTKLRILTIVTSELRFKHCMLVERLDISLGKTNCLIKANNVRRSCNNFAYLTQPRRLRGIGQMGLHLRHF